MTDDELRRLEELSAKAAKDPWSTEETVEYCGRFARNSLYLMADDRHKAILYNHLAEDKAAAEYIVAACNSLPTLIVENRKLRARVRELEQQREILAHRLADASKIRVKAYSAETWIELAEIAAKEAGE